NIEGIKILQGYGTAGTTAKSGSTGTTTKAGLAEQITGAALNYRAQAPMVDAMVRELGLVNDKEGTLEDLLTGNHTLVADALSIKDSLPTATGKINGNSNQAVKDSL
ncbi:MAG: flotillin family protein, partial [Psychromonas sp.]|nr:flotillin family protein [Psychromonas sp.]